MKAWMTRPMQIASRMMAGLLVSNIGKAKKPHVPASTAPMK